MPTNNSSTLWLIPGEVSMYLQQNFVASDFPAENKSVFKILFFISILLQCSRKSQFKVALTSRFRIACAAPKRFVKLCSKEGVSKAVKSNFLTIG